MKFSLTIETTSPDTLAKIAVLAALIEDSESVGNDFSYREMAEALHFALDQSGLLTLERSIDPLFDNIPTDLENLCREVGDDNQSYMFWEKLAMGFNGVD
jgi:hypothetical protein